MFIDVHCHLDLLKNVDEAIIRAENKRIGTIVAAGVDYDTNRKVLEYVNKYKSVKGAIGIYPIDALKMSSKGLEEEINFIYSNNEKIIAIGEVGIDLQTNDEKDKQSENFLKFIKLAKKLDKPIIVHSRKAEEICVELLEKAMVKKVVMHCFTGKMKLVKRIIENDWMLSIPGIVKYSEQFRQMVLEIDIDSLLCETDSPFLHPLRGKKNNSPENVIVSYEEISKIKGIELKKVEEKISENFKRLFGVL